MKQIELTQGKFALVDDDDFDSLNAHKWCAHKAKNTFYAVRNVSRYVSKKGGTLRMHSALVPQAACVDHIDGNGLNNQRSNLRAATTFQNSQNQTRKIAGTSSRFRGVSWDKTTGKWRSAIKSRDRFMHLGYFDCEMAAAQAYDCAGFDRGGEYFRPNFQPIRIEIAR